MSRDPKIFDRNSLPPWLRDLPLPTPPASASQAVPAPADDDIPEWLRATSEAASELPPPIARPTPPVAASAGDDIPEWLRAPAPQSGAVESSDWFAGYDRTPGLSDTSAPSGAPGPTPSDSQEMPDWLRDIVAGSGSSEAAPPTQSPISPLAPANAPQAEAEVPDWLRELSPADDIAASVPAPAAPAASSPREALAPADDPSMPDWLRELSPADDVAAGSALDEVLPPSPPVQATFESPVAPFTLDDVPPSAPVSDDAPSVAPFTLDDVPPSAPVPSGDLPPWLRQSDATADVQTEDLPPWLHGAAAEAISDAGDTPDWFDAAPPAAEQPPVIDAAPNAPDWLRNLPGDPESPPAPMYAPPLEPASEQLPGWLREEPPSTPAPTGAGETLPGWLREEPPSTPAPTGAGETLPPWMQEAQELSTAGGMPSRMQSGEAAEPESLPDWLRDLPEGEPLPASPPGAQADEAATPAPQSFVTPSSGSLPSWLSDVETGTVPAQPSLPSWLAGTPLTSSPAPAPPPPAIPPVAAHELAGQAEATFVAAASTQPSETLPPWLHAREEQTAATAPSGGDIIGAIDLPAWLKAETSEAAQEDVAESRSLDWLARLRQQDEDSETAVVPVAASVARAPIVRRSVAPDALALIQQLSAQPFPQDAMTPVEMAPRWQQAAPLERALATLLLLGLLFATLLPGLASGFASLAQPAPGSGVAQLHGIVESLDDKSVVVVAYEWDAQRSGELAPLERGITEHLIAKRAGIVTLSTDPQGALLSFNLRDRLREEGYGSGAVDDLFLGFLPGGELALRGLAQNFGGYVRRDFAGEDTSDAPFVTGQLKGRPPLTAIDQVALIVVVADEAQDVQGWVEQVRSRVPGVPMALVTPSEIGPFVRPYLTHGELLVSDARRGQLVALIGAQDALAYSELRGSSDAAAVSQLRALVGARNLGLALFVVLLGIGGVAALARRRV